MQLTGLGIALGMRGIAAGQGSLEVRCPDGVQLVRHLVGSSTRLDDGVRSARVGDDIGVRREVHSLYDWSGVRVLAERAATSAERTHRFRYQRALPSSIRIPWTIPSPVNQW